METARNVLGWLKLTPLFANVSWVMVQMILDPTDIGPTFRLRDLTELNGFKLHLDMARSDPATAKVIRERYLAGPYDVDQLAKLPEGTLGHCHAKFMKHFSIPVVFYPDELMREIREGRAGDETYLRMRFRETHDIWHTVLGIPTDGLGEMEIAAVYLRQTNLPLGGILMAIGFLYVTFRKPYGYRELMESIIKGWTLGGQVRPLLGVRWEQMWDLPIAEVRKRLGIEVVREAWEQVPEAKLDIDAQARFEAYAAGAPPHPVDEATRLRFLASAIL